MAQYLRGSTKTTKRTVKANSVGQMGINILDILSRIKKMGKGL
jgi:hypothetical protein